MKTPITFSIRQKISAVSFGQKSLPWALLFLCFLGFGLFIPWLGFYWDDWPYSWYAHILGPTGFTKIFENDRPFLSFIYSLTAFIGGERPWQWQVVGIICRWIAVLALWWSLKQIWPRYPRQITWVVFVFALYPGFGQQWISVIYSRAFILYAAFNLSFGLMAWAVLYLYRQSISQVIKMKRFAAYGGVTLLALFTALFAYLSSEYFYGIELLRPFLLWFLLANYEQNWKRRALKTFLFWLPFLAAWIAYGFWRLYYFQSVNYSVDGTLSLMASPVEALLDAFRLFTKTLLDANLTVWVDTFKLFILPLDAAVTWLTSGLVLLSLAFIVFYLAHYRVEGDAGGPDTALEVANDSWARQAIFLGLMGIGVALLPFWMADLPVELWFPWDRFFLVMAPGASFFLVGMLEWLLRSGRRKIFVFALILALSMGTHFQNANTYRRDWNNMRSIFWQLTWRIPALEPGTVILTHELPLYRYSDNSLTAPLNWIYAPEFDGNGDMPYMLIYSKARLGSSLAAIAPDVDLSMDYRATTFHGSTSQAVVISQTGPACLRVLDPEYVNEKSIPGEPYQLTGMIPFSRIDVIIPQTDTPAIPPLAQFGKEPPHEWCYYFEKAELARQVQNWEEVQKLANDALQQGFAPHSTAQSEWFVFIEGYAHTGQWDKAERLTFQINEIEPVLRPGLCGMWRRIESDFSGDYQARAADMISRIGCE